MKIGCLINVFCEAPLADVLSFCKSIGIEMVEIGCGAIPGINHCDAEQLLKDDAEFGRFRATVERSGLGVSAFACHANPVHPVRAIAERFDRALRSGVLLAEKMGVDTVVCFSGAPGDCPETSRPNWVTHAFPYDGIATLDYQWNNCLIPYWRDFSKFAGRHGVRIAIEMHPGWAVSDPESLIMLRENCGDNIGANFDPSHLIWQGIDCPTAIRRLSGLVYHFHAKDTLVDEEEMGKNGFFTHSGPISSGARPFQFKMPTYGTGELYWKKMLTALRESGYDGTLSIEHEDVEFGQFDGVIRAHEILRGMIYREPAARCGWKASIKEYQKTFLPVKKEAN
ncbi:MAG: sugar phosphate isomerase/epimerase [Clostridiales bacterium]|nr:sugar phosphate isomerase/epimerase [Clostridiales bacterium]